MTAPSSYLPHPFLARRSLHGLIAQPCLCVRSVNFDRIAGLGRATDMRAPNLQKRVRCVNPSTSLGTGFGSFGSARMSVRSNLPKPHLRVRSVNFTTSRTSNIAGAAGRKNPHSYVRSVNFGPGHARNHVSESVNFARKTACFWAVSAIACQPKRKAASNTVTPIPPISRKENAQPIRNSAPGQSGRACVRF